jgi:hypothetical protein
VRKSNLRTSLPLAYEKKINGVVYENPHLDVEYGNVSIRRTGNYSSNLCTEPND